MRPGAARHGKSVFRPLDMVHARKCRPARLWTSQHRRARNRRHLAILTIRMAGSRAIVCRSCPMTMEKSRCAARSSHSRHNTSPSGVTTIGWVRPWCISHARGSLSAQADLAGSDRGGSFLLSCFVGANDAPFLNAADYMAKRIPGARKIVHSRRGPRVRRGQKMLPGLRVFFGSSAVLIARIIATSVSLRLIDSQGFFSSPMPCSAETDPRSDFSAP